MEETKDSKKKISTKKATTTKKTASKKPTTTKKTSTVKKEPVVKVEVTQGKKEESQTTNEYVHEVDAFAAISLILGFASLITWLYPILGVAIAIPGLSIGIVTHETRRSNYSLLGIIMCLVGIILSIIKAFSVC